MRQRAYPNRGVAPGAYNGAIAAYLQGREAARARYAERLMQAASGKPLLPDSIPTGPWAEVGPAPINNTISYLTFGNVAGRISAVAVHPTNANIVLIGSSRGGIWRTANATATPPTWSPVGDGLSSLVIGDVQFAPSNGNIAYAATGDDDSFFWGRGVMKSTDAGLTWARVDNGSAANGIENGTVLSKLTIDPTNPNTVVALGYLKQDPAGGNFYSFVFRSTDAGATWSKATIPTTPGGNQSGFRSLAIESGCPANLWLVDYYSHNLKRSVDGGATWSTLAASGLPAFTGNSKLAVQHSSCIGNGRLYVSVFSGDGLAGSANYPGVYVSTDGGALFSLPGATPGPSGGCLGQCGYDHELFVDPTDSTRVYMLGRDFWTSSDSGATWANRSAAFDDANNYYGGNMHSDQHAIAISGGGGTATIYEASDGGLWAYSVAANTFTNKVGNLAISEFMDLAVRPDQPNQAIGGLQDNGSILYSGTPQWIAKLGGDGGASGWLPTVAGTGIYDGGFTTYITNTGYKSTDAGANWTGISNAASFASESAEFYAPWIGTAGDNRLWHGARSLWYCGFPAGCTTAGWSKLGTTDLATFGGGTYLSKLAINNPAAGVFGPFYAAVSYNRAFLQSADGLTWNNRTGTLPNRYISRIVFDPATPARVWVTLQGFGTGHVYYSPDGGVTWSDKSGTLPNVPVNTILLDPLDAANTWYVGTDVGVYGTIDGGATWSAVGSNLPAMTITDLELDQNRLLYAATGGRSVWTITLPGGVCAFAGLASATNNSTATCKLDLAWNAGSAPCGAPLRYNVYRSTSSGFTPSAANRIASCLSGTSFSDQSVASGTPYYYVVRMETPIAGSGPCGGTEETNLTQRSATAGGGGTLTAFSDTFESGSGLNGWASGYFNDPNLLGNNATDWRGIESCVNHTTGGVKDFRFGDLTCGGTYSAEKWSFVTPGGVSGIAIPAGATATRLSFWHQWNFETGYDGAQLLLSDGAGYYFVPASAILSGGYNSTVIDDVGVCGYVRQAANSRIWSGTSTAAFTNVVVDLDAACNATGTIGGCAGRSVKIAFTALSDCSTNRTGWFIDDVQVTYTASASCSAASPPAEVSGGATPLRVSKSGANLGFSWQDQALAPQDYNLYQGILGAWYGHTLFNCHLTTPQISCATGVCTVGGLAPGAGSRYYLLTSSGPGGESNAGGAGWSGPNHITAPVYNVPAACGGN